MSSTLCLRGAHLATLLLLLSGFVARAEVPTVAQLGYTDYPGILHCHSYLSHDSKGTNAEIIAAAKKAGVRFIMMTDHPSKGGLAKALRGMHGGVLFFPGLEKSHMLLVDVRRPLKRAGVAGARKEMIEQGGMTFVAHTESFRHWQLKLTGMEIYNIHSDILTQNKITMGLRFLAKYYKDRDWAFAQLLKRPTAFLARWDSLTLTRRVVGVAGNDAHQNIKIGREQIDPYERSFSFVQTHVLSPKLTLEDIKLNLASGHAYVAFDLFGKAQGFSFTAKVGAKTLLMGDQVKAFSGSAVLSARFPKTATIRLIRNGKLIETVEGKKLERTVTESGVYRVEADIVAKGKSRPWIYSNPIYVQVSGGIAMAASSLTASRKLAAVRR